MNNHIPDDHQQQRTYDDGLIVTNHVYPEVASPGHGTSGTSPPPAFAPYSDKSYHQQGQQPPQVYTPYSPTPATATTATSHSPPIPPTKNEETISARRRSIWKRPATWTVIALFVIVVVLAGILGGIASGSIKTSGNNSNTTTTTTTTQPAANSSATSAGSNINSTSPSTTPTGTSSPTTTTSSSGALNPSVSTKVVQSDLGPVTLECPSAQGLNYTVVATADGQPPAVYRRYCDVNFAKGDMGIVNDQKILSMPECLAACANRTGCVGAVFNPSPQCWLKSAIGVKTPDVGSESAVLWQ
ncbi:hypothetical protein B0H66DRAFT_604092 [Apodospora peruviana]|uniref:Apple domain-containing protein n=1 Tax=Apodospora peruviana TaxID=516989 RepID=A0AAE0HZI4_9PEZI|nr:hypothetical protein B0H66DRAFT_604092 [Apodospora peruviana]